MARHSKTEISRVHQLTNDLREKILNNVLKPNLKLMESEISDEYKISVSTIREAFRILESEGIISMVPGMGTFVADIVEEDIELVYEIRPDIEALAAKLACRNITGVELNYLSDIVDKIEAAIEKKDITRYFELNKNFHDTTHKVTRNQYLIKTLQELSNKTFRYRLFPVSFSYGSSGSGFRQMKQSNKAHQKLVEAFRERNEKKAAQVRYKQVEKIGKTLSKAKSIRSIVTQTHM